MAYPPAYTRAYSFTDFEVNFPGEPKPGDKLDTEYDAVSNALTGTQNALALIQRADGQLANGSVGVDQLQTGLFDGIADGITDDAEDAADAAAASASAAATSASQAQTSATDAAASAGTASGAAAQAGVSQGIAQDAANEAALSATDADTSADVSVQAANDTAGSVAACEAHVERAFEWAELLTGPVLPAPPGWPEAVDDGMFSSKWWAIRARNYNAVHHIDLGTAGTNPAEAFVIWDAIPGNDLADPPGLVYATWGTPPRTYVLIDPFDPSDPDSWMDITGADGPPGPPNTLTIGTVTTGAPSAATITGTSPNQVLNLTLEQGPQGIQGIQGIPGPPVALANPTGVIGLVAVNGVATTAPRSDSSPALSQAIVPTWTGAHTFNSTVDLAGPVKASAAEGVSGQVLSSQGAGLPTVWRNPGGGSIELLWNFSTAVGTANPGSQKMSLNSAAYTAVTTAVFNSLAQTNFDANAILGLLQTGNRIYMQQRTDATKAVVYQVTGAATNAGGYWTVPVTHVNSLGATMFTVNTDIICVFIMSASGAAAAAAGSNTQVQYNNAGAFGADAGFTYNSATSSVSLFGTEIWPNFSANIPVNGATVTMAANKRLMFINPAGALATLTVTLPPSAVDGQVTAILTTQTITAITINGSGADTVATSVTSLPANTGVHFFYRSGVWRQWTGAGPGVANPTASLGLTAVNGSANTAMRSDGAPALSQAIAPTWTGQHAWSLPLRAPNGTVSLPSYSFTGDVDTGMYTGAADNTLRFTTGGVITFYMDSTNSRNISYYPLLHATDGTTAAPSFSWNSDTDLGLYRESTNTMGVSVGNFRAVRFSTDAGTVGRMTINSNGATGAALSVTQDGTATYFQLLGNGACTGASFTTTSARALKRETGAPSKPANILARLRPILYRLFTDESHEQLGLIAEEVHEVCPQLSDGKSVAYDRLAILLLAAWQDEHAEAA